MQKRMLWISTFLCSKEIMLTLFLQEKWVPLLGISPLALTGHPVSQEIQEHLLLSSYFPPTITLIQKKSPFFHSSKIH